MNKKQARQAFMEMFNNLPPLARRELVYKPYGRNPMSLNVIAIEVKAKTKLADDILKGLGYGEKE